MDPSQDSDIRFVLLVLSVLSFAIVFAVLPFNYRSSLIVMSHVGAEAQHSCSVVAFCSIPEAQSASSHSVEHCGLMVAYRLSGSIFDFDPFHSLLVDTGSHVTQRNL